MKRLTQERLKKGWTKTELGMRAKLHPVDVGKLENGRTHCWQPWAQKLEAVFLMPIDELLKDVSNG